MADKNIKETMSRDAKRINKPDIHDVTYLEIDGVEYALPGNLPVEWKETTEEIRGGQMQSTVCYRPDGTLLGRKSPDSSITYYFPDGKTVMISEDKEGNRTCYQEDGRISYTEGKDGVKTFYDAEGKNPKFQITADGNTLIDLKSGRTFESLSEYAEYRSRLNPTHDSNLDEKTSVAQPATLNISDIVKTRRSEGRF